MEFLRMGTTRLVSDRDILGKMRQKVIHTIYRVWIRLVHVLELRVCMVFIRDNNVKIRELRNGL